MIATPDGLQTIGVGAVLAHLGDLVAFDQQAVVAVGVDRVLAEGTDELVADDLHFRAPRLFRRAGIDALAAAGDAVVFDRHRVGPGLDHHAVGDDETRQGQVRAREAGAFDRRSARILGAQNYP